MDIDSREMRLLQSFATLADTLVDDYDVVDLLQALVDTCGELLEFTAAGILLEDGRGDLELVASTSEGSRLVETMQLSAEAGPCIQCYRSGEVVSVPHIAASPSEWAAFRESALAQGFRSVDAVPLRLRDATIGTLNLLRTTPGPPDPADLLTARALADVATIGILHERTLREAEVLSQQLQVALNTRVVIEQAKGVVAFTNGIPIDEAFGIIRGYARRNGLAIREVAARLIARQLRIDPESEPPSRLQT